MEIIAVKRVSNEFGRASVLVSRDGRCTVVFFFQRKSVESSFTGKSLTMYDTCR